MNSLSASFGNSVFAEISALAAKHGAVNLGQGYPDFDTPENIKDAAITAIREGRNQYAISHGEVSLRQAVCAHALRFYGQDLDPNSNVCVTSGASEALWCAAVAHIERDDEVIVFEPAFDVYLPDIRMAGGIVKAVTLHAPDFRFDPSELRAAFSEKTKVIFINTPHNPCGTVFNDEELRLIRDLCCEYDVLAISDEVYEHIIYEPFTHRRLATYDGMQNRCISISSGGKTFSSTGWKCGWAIGSEENITAIRRIHQFTVFASATPVQYAIAQGLSSPDNYYEHLRQAYTARRSLLFQALRETRLKVQEPQGSYFITADISDITSDDGVAFSHALIRDAGVAVIPSQKFYVNEERGRSFVRFAFCKKDETLHEAIRRLDSLR